ncbi:MAG TPA: sigma-70 family RNA polymerase sigma factor [Verrucomicrobiae bacterium]
MSGVANNDAELVNGTLAGNRDAFGQIVSRYQSLICSLAYSATGSLGQSEDLAQETFITAWKHLRHLREQDKLRAWLCGIARNRINNFLRREGREPIREAEPLENLAESRSVEPLPVDQTISNEEAAILWRSLEKIPVAYREPLILFYREHQSIETVAENLELSEDAVKQRLSRGRKLLQEEVLAFVEGALTRTSPGKIFTIGVLAALPASLATSAKAATISAAAAKGSMMAKTATAVSVLSLLSSPLLILFGNYAGYRMSLAEADSDMERHYIKAFYKKVVICAAVLFALFAGVILWFCQHQTFNVQLTLLVTGFILTYIAVIFTFAAVFSGARKKFLAGVLAQNSSVKFSEPAWEFCSRASFLGLPLVHIRIGDRFALLKEPVKAWIAVGERSYGGLFAFGGVAVAPISIGGVAIGIFPFGAVTLGICALGGFAFGVWALGGLAVGWQACGGCALAWDAASGGIALAQHIASGGMAHALQANNEFARQFINSNLFFRWSEFYGRHSFLMNLIWATPMVIFWRITQRRRAQQSQS